MRRLLLGVLTTACLLAGIAGGAAAQTTGPTLLVDDLEVSTVATDLAQPIGIAFVDDDEALVLEKATGRVQHLVDGEVAATALDLAVNSASERGLLGIALHSGFPATPWVYLYWTESSTGADTTDPAAVPLLGNRVDRYVWDGTTLTHDRPIIALRARQHDAGQPERGNHDGGVLTFGADGMLYVIVGDVGRRGYLQNVLAGFGPGGDDDQYGGPEPDAAHLTGVILRLDEDGDAPSDNPFVRAARRLPAVQAEAMEKVFAFGVRNSFGMAVDPEAGHLWTQDNAEDAFDEINRVEAGFNGGWIQHMGPLRRHDEYVAIERNEFGGAFQQLRWPPSLLAERASGALRAMWRLPGSRYTDPEFSWRYPVPPAGIGFVDGDGLGSGYAGDLFVGGARDIAADGMLMRFELSASRRHLVFDDPRLRDRVADNAAKHDLTESESLLVGSGFGVLPDLETGPDGRLYAVSLSHGAVYAVEAAD